MLKRHARAACTALATAGLLLAGTSGATADSAPPAPAPASAATTLRTADAPPELLAALQRDLGLTPTQAKARLAHEAEAGATAARLRDRLGAAFAGAWVDGADASTLTVATTRAADTAAIRATGARAQLVTRALADLDGARAALDRAAGPTTPVRYVDPRSNTLVVEETEAGAAAALLAATGIDAALVTVVRTAEAPRPLHDLRGGDAYYMNGSGRCSVGFPVTKGTTHGFATAGHCGRAGTTTTGFNRVAQGTFQASVFPGNDMAWVAANAQWTSTPYVKGSGGANVQVTGSVLQPVGASVCRSGSTTGWHCGTIQQHNDGLGAAERPGALAAGLTDPREAGTRCRDCQGESRHLRVRADRRISRSRITGHGSRITGQTRTAASVPSAPKTVSRPQIAKFTVRCSQKTATNSRMVALGQ